jgi:hypothetical protein
MIDGQAQAVAVQLHKYLGNQRLGVWVVLLRRKVSACASSGPSCLPVDSGL